MRIMITSATRSLLVRLAAVNVLVVSSILSSYGSAAAVSPANFQTDLIVGSGLDGPSGFEIAPDGRLFVLERAGLIKVVKSGVLLPTPFADLPSEASGDRGLIGIAFDPAFGVSNHYVYFYYTGHDLLNHLVRFDASTDVGTDGPYTIFETQSPSQLLHVGGSIRFGPDGKLYFAVGDNGYPPNGQDLSNPHGKILRINADGSVPADNPFAGQPGKLGAIWAYGFRNPWRFQFDPANGELYGGDVGDYTWEELNHIVKGGNYGWPVNEGNCTSSCAGYIDPIHAYNHNGGSASVTGGPVYRADQFPAEYQGSLFFGDYGAGFIKRAVLDANGNVASIVDFDTAAGTVVDLKVAPDGSLYYLTYYPGALYRVSYTLGNQTPKPVASADVTTGPEPLLVHFSSAGTNDPDGDPLTYSWDLGDGTTSTDPNPVKTYADVGVYQVRLTVSDGSRSATATPIVVQVGTPPTLTVASPVEGSTYAAGEQITYNAFASDAAGLDLNDASISTVVLLHHHTHVHPFLGPLLGRVGTFTIPDTGEASADTWYEVNVTATDSGGLSATKSVLIYPRTQTFTLATDPVGLTVLLDGVPTATPSTVDGVVNFRREIAAPPTAVDAAGQVYDFTGWSDGGAIRHVINTPATATTYTAQYVPQAGFTGEYFANRDLAGAPVLTRTDPAIDFLWSTNAPDPAVPADNFSARWSGTRHFATGRYAFTTATDDGVRLYLDGQLVIDGWRDQSGYAYTYVADLVEGDHALVMEYYDNAVDATAKLSWETTIDQPDSAWTGRFWNTPGAGSSPTIPLTTPGLILTEAAIDHEWGDGSPGLGIGADHFAARWTKSALLPGGVYQVVVTGDDGVRFIVDGQRVIDQWVDQGATTSTVTLSLAAGTHPMSFEYYENGGGAVAKASLTKIGELPPATGWHGEFWNSGVTEIPSADPVYTVDTSEIDYSWGDGSPSPAIDTDNFVARFTRTVMLPGGTYTFSGASDDGIRLKVDGVTVLEKWRDQNEAFSVDAVIAAGQHELTVEYFEHGAGALLALRYLRSGTAPPQPTWTTRFYPNTTLAGQPALIRGDQEINFDWGSGSPSPGIPSDEFSARWTKEVSFAQGTHRFTATADDGVRVMVDGVVIIDAWSDHPPTTYTADLTLTSGPHTITVEYYEHGGGALMRLAVDMLP
jgi:glucose/arabinose dehydrogenase